MISDYNNYQMCNITLPIVELQPHVDGDCLPLSEWPTVTDETDETNNILKIMSSDNNDINNEYDYIINNDDEKNEYDYDEKNDYDYTKIITMYIDKYTPPVEQVSVALHYASKYLYEFEKKIFKAGILVLEWNNKYESWRRSICNKHVSTDPYILANDVIKLEKHISKKAKSQLFMMNWKRWKRLLRHNLSSYTVLSATVALINGIKIPT